MWRVVKIDLCFSVMFAAYFEEPRLSSVFTHRITTFSAAGTKRKILLHLLFAHCF